MYLVFGDTKQYRYFLEITLQAAFMDIKSFWITVECVDYYFMAKWHIMSDTLWFNFSRCIHTCAYTHWIFGLFDTWCFRWLFLSSQGTWHVVCDVTVLSDTFWAAAIWRRADWGGKNSTHFRQVKVTASALPNCKWRLVNYSM